MRIGLVGHGAWGERILADLLRLEVTVEVAEPSEERRRSAGALGAAATFAELDEIGEVDGIIVATPASSHADHVERLLPRGVPILCEKPLTTDPESARRLVSRSKGQLFVGHVWSYHRGVEALASIAREGELGTVRGLRTTRTNWTSPRRDVDPIWTLAPHDISLGLLVLGAIPEPRFAVAELDAENRPVGMFGALGRDPWLVFDVSARYGDKRREIRLHCSEGVAVLPGADSPAIEIWRGVDGLQADRERRPVGGEPALRRELAAFCHYLAGGPPPKADGAEGLAVVEAVSRLRELAGLD